jgi:hypothetical protein
MLSATLAARRTACAFLREAWAPATWAGVGWAAAASRASLGFAEHLKLFEYVPVPPRLIVVMNILEHVTHLVWAGWMVRTGWSVLI